MKDLTTIGIDIAKTSIQLHGIDNKGKKVLTKRLTRHHFLAYMANLPKCLIGMEACGSAHYLAKALGALGFEVKLMSPRKVKKYVENNKNDAKDAAACAEAVGRGSMTFVPIKTEGQLEIQAIHRVRSQFIKQRTGLMNMIRGLLYERGLTVPQGRSALLKKLSLSLPEDNSMSEQTKEMFRALLENLKHLDKEIDHYTQQLETLAKEDELCQRIQTISGIAEITATALIAKIGNGSGFKKGRELSAYLGLVPKQCSSGEKQLLLGISKHGDKYLRKLLIHGGRACVQAAMRKNKLTGLFCKNDEHSQWIRKLRERVGTHKASVAVANKNARMVVALLKNKTTFQPSFAHTNVNDVVDFVKGGDKCDQAIRQFKRKGEAFIPHP